MKDLNTVIVVVPSGYFPHSDQTQVFFTYDHCIIDSVCCLSNVNMLLAHYQSHLTHLLIFIYSDRFASLCTITHFILNGLSKKSQ